LETLKKAGYWVIGTAADAARTVTEVDWQGPTVLVLGGESDGMRPLIQTKCNDVASIPLAAKSESLNVSVAASICLWEARRARDNQLYRAQKMHLSALSRLSRLT
ncbi:MAG: hypothetical protein EOO77_30540, partial [Oxalobacteraceae bacterium]